jgi:hypothetical protein
MYFELNFNIDSILVLILNLVRMIILSDRKIMEDYCTDICNLVDILNKLTNSYRLLIGGAGELNSIGLARKNQIRDAIDRAVDLGNIIDKVMKSLDKSSCAYFDYCELKCKFLNNKVIEAYVLTEINEELQLKNQVNNKPEGNNEKKEGSSS